MFTRVSRDFSGDFYLFVQKSAQSKEPEGLETGATAVACGAVALKPFLGFSFSFKLKDKKMKGSQLELETSPLCTWTETVFKTRAEILTWSSGALHPGLFCPLCFGVSFLLI